MAGFSWADKRVLVTGASSGIGRATAIAAADRGARVGFVARRADRMESIRSGLPDPSRGHVFACDLYDEAARADLGRRVRDELGTPDVLVLNAGVSQRALVEETSLDAVRKLMELNFFAVVHLTQMFLSDFLARRSGHIVVVSSVVGYVSTPKRSAYAASKHALQGYFKALRAEVGARGVGVNIVCPGYVKTDIGAGSLRGDGTPRGAGGAAIDKGIAPEKAASALLHAVERNRRETYVGARRCSASTCSASSPASWPGPHRGRRPRAEVCVSP
jgi:dehydrogenase/reductase SDR family protein 7B